jgi:CRP-like cAMP-binding protein
MVKRAPFPVHLFPMQPMLDGYSTGNLLLDALPHRDRAGLNDRLTILTLHAQTITHMAGDEIRHVDFPIATVFSVVTTLDTGDTIDVGPIGHQNFVESDAALGLSKSQRTSICNISGTVARMDIRHFYDRMASQSAFAALIRRNVQAMLFSTQQQAACNAVHSVLERSAGRLCRIANCIGKAEITLTHDRLAEMLGVRRAGVTEALGILRKRGAIGLCRGTVTILDNALLKAATCECYQTCERVFATALQDRRASSGPDYQLRMTRASTASSC